MKPCGALDVMLNAAEVCPFAVAVNVISPIAELNKPATPVTVIVAPVSAETWTFPDPDGMFHVVEEPPDEVSIIEVAYPDGFAPLKNQTVFGPEIAGVTLTCACGVYMHPSCWAWRFNGVEPGVLP